jgi:uncharacterized membrane protein YphA (DoxX/SURF4 family)
MERLMNFEKQTKATRGSRLIWAGRIVLSLIFLGAAGTKFAGVPEIVELFERIGFGQWFRYLTGTIEAAGAVLLLIPSGGLFCASLLAAVMVGAIITNIALGLNPVGAIVLLLAAVILGWAIRRT